MWTMSVPTRNGGVIVGYVGGVRGSPKVTSPKSKPCLEWVRGGCVKRVKCLTKSSVRRRDVVAHYELPQQTAFSSSGNPTRGPFSSPRQNWPKWIEAHTFEEISQRTMKHLNIPVSFGELRRRHSLEEEESLEVEVNSGIVVLLKNDAQ
ncbi:hypothetical protein ACMD2_06854 [Ananas comosus]|uniref:Uncharacterized protein n=1 Tax=Ananas comosus TaxID=4615 RepID=A0A199W769_ANACO|nr:hypothetical protein ACMD2_06854 [Ananas comosus]